MANSATVGCYDRKFALGYWSLLGPVQKQSGTQQTLLSLEENGTESRELVKFGYSENCDGCNAAKLGTEAKPHSEGSRERIRQAMMNEDMDQQMLQEAGQRRATTGSQVPDAPRAEVAQEGQDVEMTATHAPGNVESSEAQPVETSSRMEDVSVSRWVT